MVTEHPRTLESVRKCQTKILSPPSTGNRFGDTLLGVYWPFHFLEPQGLNLGVEISLNICPAFAIANYLAKA